MCILLYSSHMEKLWANKSQIFFVFESSTLNLEWMFQRFLQPVLRNIWRIMDGKSISEFELSYSYRSYTLNFLFKLTTIIFGYSLADLQRNMNIITSTIWNSVWINFFSIFKVSFVVENVKSKKAEMNHDIWFHTIIKRKMLWLCCDFHIYSDLLLSNGYVLQWGRISVMHDVTCTKVS